MEKVLILGNNDVLTSLKNCEFLGFYKSRFLQATFASYFLQLDQILSFYPNLHFLTKSTDLPLWKKCEVLTFFKLTFLYVRLPFFPELHQTLLLIHFALKQKMEKSEFLTKSFLEKCQFQVFIVNVFIVYKGYSCFQNFTDFFLTHVALKEKMEKV